MNNTEFDRDKELKQKNYDDRNHEDLAELWRRVVAFLINLLVVFLFTWLIFTIGTGELFPNIGNVEAGELIKVWFLYLMTIFGGVFFYTYRSDHLSGNRTVGKRIMKIQVLDLEGKNLSHGRAVLRTLGMILTCLTIFIGFFIAIFRKDKRTLHEMIAKTKVVKIE